MIPSAVNSRKYGSDFEIVEPAAKTLLHPHLDAVEHVRVADADDLRRRPVEPGAHVADRRGCRAPGSSRRPRRAPSPARDVELVVDVHVRVEPLRLERRDRLARELDVDRHVQEPRAVGVDDDRALVADRRLVEDRAGTIRWRDCTMRPVTTITCSPARARAREPERSRAQLEVAASQISVWSRSVATTETSRGKSAGASGSGRQERDEVGELLRRSDSSTSAA